MATYTRDSVFSAAGRLSAVRRHHPENDSTAAEQSVLEQKAGYALSRLRTQHPGVQLDGDALERVMAVLR